MQTQQTHRSPSFQKSRGLKNLISLEWVSAYMATYISSTQLVGFAMLGFCKPFSPKISKVFWAAGENTFSELGGLELASAQTDDLLQVT